MKAILIIDDMPKTCGGCPCMRVSNTGFVCQEEWRDVVDPDHIPSWCPLRPLPSKIDVTVKRFEDIQSYSITEVADNISARIILKTDEIFALGWNACLEEIIGETE